MGPDRVSGPLTYESGALPTAKYRTGNPKLLIMHSFYLHDLTVVRDLVGWLFWV